MARRLAASSLLLIFLWSLLPAAAAEKTVRFYALPDHGQLALRVPDTWADNVSQPPDRIPPTISFKETSGAAFAVLVTPVWPAPGHAQLTLEEAKKIVASGAEKAAAQAVEKNVPIKNLPGDAGSGFYFQATDKAPKSGEYKFMTQGAIVLDQLIVTFTALTNDGQREIVVEALAMVVSAQHRR